MGELPSAEGRNKTCYLSSIRRRKQGRISILRASITIYAKTSASFRHGEPIRRLDDTRIHGVAFYEEIVVVVVVTYG